MKDLQITPIYEHTFADRDDEAQAELYAALLEAAKRDGVIEADARPRRIEVRRLGNYCVQH